MVCIVLPGREALIDCKPVLADQMSDDCGTISNRLAIVDNIRELAARRGRGVKDVLDEQRASLSI